MSWREWFGAAPTRRAFAQRLLAALQAEGRHAWRLEDDGGSIRNDAGGTLNLANLHLRYVATPRAARRDCLRQFVAMAHSPAIPKLWTLAERKVYAVVRSRHDGLAQRIATGDDAFAALQRPLLDDLVVKLVFDFGDHVQYVAPSDVDTWGRSLEDVHRAALRNLGELDSPTWEPLGPGVHRLHSEVSYAESMLLLERVVGMLPYARSAVCCPSNRGVLFAADGDDEAAVAALVEHAMQALTAEPWPLSGTLCVRRDGAWQRYQPPAALADAARGLSRLDLAAVHGEQQRALDEEYERSGRDVYVAGFTLIRRERGIESVAVWAQGVATLLPQTDLIAFSHAGKDRKTLLVDWDAARRIVGHRMQPEAQDPPRWLVTEFPSAAEFERLAAEAR